MIVAENLQQTRASNEQQHLRQQHRAKKPTNSARKTLQLLEHFMPQNRRIYNFGVKTLQPRLMGKQRQESLHFHRD